MALFDQLDQLALGEHRMGQIQAGKFDLLRMIHAQGIQHPVVQFAVVHKLQSTERMRDALQRVGQAMRKIIG